MAALKSSAESLPKRFEPNDVPTVKGAQNSQVYVIDIDNAEDITTVFPEKVQIHGDIYFDVMPVIECDGLMLGNTVRFKRDLSSSLAGKRAGTIEYFIIRYDKFGAVFCQPNPENYKCDYLEHLELND